MQASFGIVEMNPHMPIDTQHMPGHLCTDARILHTRRRGNDEHHVNTEKVCVHT